MRIWFFIVPSLFSLVFAQDIRGTFVQQDDPSTIITLETQNDSYVGTLLNSGTDQFGIEASMQEGYLTGYFLVVDTDQAAMFFLAEPTTTGFNIAVAPLDEQGKPVETAVETYSFIHQQRADTSQSSTTILDPLATPEGAQQNGAPSFAGTYSGQAFDVVLQENDTGYSGTILLDGQSLLLKGTVSGNTLTGSFFANGQAFPFEARLEDTTLSFISESEHYNLSKQASPNSPRPSNQTTTSPQGFQTISFGQQYPAGTWLFSPWTGVSFTVPENHTAYFDTEFGAFLMVTADGSSILALEAASTARAEDLGYYAIDALAETLSPDDPSFQLLAPPIYSEDLITARFFIAGTQLSAAARQGEAENAAVVIAYGVQAEQLVQTVAQSFEFSPPKNDVERWRQQLSGLHLYANQSTSDISSGPSAIGAKDSQGEYEYDFCGDGTFQHAFSDVSYYSVMDSTPSESGYYMTASYKSGSEGSYYGSWTLVSLIMGNPLLILESTQGGVFMHYIEETSDGANIDGRSFDVSPSQQC